ncbi:alpha-amylase [Kordia sp. SMS9]|uniref:T9SS type A sorting domain-containing protein n=1 Tax=Kordia sp. SMS9 TaxID=2282170 RepID=UPI000E0DF68F|nr:T9SS type A sorting domain-containing protein [Kordia sp. SMS9]AXG71846.1 alpha-amylase [Kordia sp. SMS9]
MKRKLLFVITLFISSITLAQDTEAPTTPANFQIVYNIASPEDSFALQWDHATDNVGVTTYEIYINGALDEIIPFDNSNTVQYASFGRFNNGTYCFTILAKDAAGNASALSPQDCGNVNVIYQNPPRKPYFSGFLNYAGDNKAIEIAYENFGSSSDLSNYSLKISHNGSGTWDTVYTFPSSASISPNETFVIAHPNISICSTFVNDYDSTITNFDGNDVIGLFKYDTLYDVVGGNLGSSTTAVNTDIFLKKEILTAIHPITTFNINDWNVYPNTGSCPNMLGFSFLVLLDVEDETTATFQIYPNPTNGDVVYINTKNNAEISTMTIHDVSGKLVLQQVNPSNEINIQQLEQGVYFLQLQIGNQTVTKKLIRQ